MHTTMKSLTNINAGIVLQALRSATPITATGKAAVENYKQWLTANSLNAIALENSIISLTGSNRDAGLESLIATLKGIMPESKRKVAVAFEMVQMEPKNLFSVSDGALEALTKLYDYDAEAIIDKINEGALDPFASNPIVAKLIQWAKRAVQIEPERKYNVDGEVVNTIVPILNLAAIGDDMLIAIDGRLFVQTKRGALTYVPFADDYDISDDVKILIQCLSQMQSSSTEPNVLVVKPEVLDIISKALPMQSFEIDLLGDASELVRINGNAMSVEKAMSLLKASESDLLASMLMSDDAKNGLQLVATIMNIFERFRGVLGNEYANKFAIENMVTYIVEKGGAVAEATFVSGSLVESKLFNSIFDLLTSDMFVATPKLHAAISTAFASELKEDAKKLSIRKQIAIKLAEERKQYEALLERINNELDNLATVVDVNPDKVDGLKSLETKTEDKLAVVIEEIEKLSK